MEKLCLCDTHFVKVQDATYVINGRPACSAACYQRALDRPGASRDVPVGQSWAFTFHRTQAEVTRIVALPNGGFDVVG